MIGPFKNGDKLARGSIIARTASGIKFELTANMQALIKRAKERPEPTEEELAKAKEWEEGLPRWSPLPTGTGKFAVFVPRSGEADKEEEEDGDNVAAGRE